MSQYRIIYLLFFYDFYFEKRSIFIEGRCYRPRTELTLEKDDTRYRSLSISVAEVRLQKPRITQFLSQLRSRNSKSKKSMLYTPPPMLSPIRNGSGLFWHIVRSVSQTCEVVFLYYNFGLGHSIFYSENTENVGIYQL